MSKVFDSKGDELKVGDIVTILDKYADATAITSGRGYCNFLKDVKYKVTEIVTRLDGRINVVHEPTGLVNGWCANYFTKVDRKTKSHYPEWW